MDEGGDDVVRHCGGTPAVYVRSMVRAAETVVRRRQQLLEIGMAETFSNLGGRIRRMMHTSYRSSERIGFAYFGAVLILGLFCAVLSCKGPEQPTVYTMGKDAGKDVKPPVVLNQPLPAYTDEARQARAEGVVQLQAIIRKDGSVDTFKILKGLGYGLDESAINTIKTKWRFQPGTLNGKPVDVQADIEVSFKLY
jgi:TonB family protein